MGSEMCIRDRFLDCMTNSWHTTNHMAAPRSTRSVSKRAMKISGKLQAGRTNKKAYKEERVCCGNFSNSRFGNEHLRHDTLGARGSIFLSRGASG